MGITCLRPLAPLNRLANLNALLAEKEGGAGKYGLPLFMVCSILFKIAFDAVKARNGAAFCHSFGVTLYSRRRVIRTNRAV
ncbi:hypothetical protein D3870_00695 [Noviherbaspirillum cavernae]|uniref:Uncharacterized protein n=1 Tax=Noviherbaspirillum cavernae TaxID=2320862 RepID=A0A418WX06_9BURK|nr:hypothetical protein D3870_00695 [Noviherbaspirillum cavernae]